MPKGRQSDTRLRRGYFSTANLPELVFDCRNGRRYLAIDFGNVGLAWVGVMNRIEPPLVDRPSVWSRAYTMTSHDAISSRRRL